MSITTLFCDNWEFVKTPFGTEYSDALPWKRTDIPHDWLIHNTKALYETSTGWYRRKFDYTPDDNMIALRFDGVYMDTKVYVNNQLAGEWKYGYSTFEIVISHLLHEGENLIAVKVDHHEPNTRWYSGAGIFRPVYLKSYPETRIVPDGIYISADMYGDMTITTEVERPEGTALNGISLRHTVLLNGNEVARIERPCRACDKSCVDRTVQRDGCAYSLNDDRMKIKKPLLWDVDAPVLYTLRTELIQDGKVIDREETRFGFRKAEFTPDKGFFLNDSHIKLHGACEHHDLGCLGAAVNRTALRRKLEKLREIGINAIRTSHNMPAVELMKLADEMGFLILSEAFDMWEVAKTTYDYARFFNEWVDRDISSWVRRDRNHPSLIGWSIGNEIPEVCTSERAQEVTAMLLNRVRRHDNRCNGYVTMGCNYMQTENGQKCTDILKLAGYNYAERLYEQHHAEHPDWMIYGSETASVIQSRGIYHFPLSTFVMADDDEQCSSLGNCATGWGAKTTEACIIPDRDAEFCAGQFIWTGFDYIGEPTPYSTKNSYFGQYDTAGFAKDSAYVFRAEWTDYKQSPFVHIFPYWDFNDGEDIDVRVTTNAPRVKLFFNGNEIGAKDIDHCHGKELTLNTVLKYEKGELLAIAYDENGNEIARDAKRSFGDTAEIRLTPDKTELSADGTDLIFVDISAYDKDGEFVANANDRVFVEVNGAGRLIGLDNGDSTDFEQYKGTSRRLFSGKLLAVIAAKLDAGDITLRATTSRGLESTVTLKAVAADNISGVSAVEENALCEYDCTAGAEDVPVRKIAIYGGSKKFTAECNELTFHTDVYPSDSTYKDEIEYRITTVMGITSNLAEIVSVENGNVTVRCKGDGEFWLRALCRNGTDKYHIISVIKLCGEGLGDAFIDPYNIVKGGLRSVESGNIGNGFQRGAKFAGGDSWFGFENVDFGEVGSDTVTFPAFAYGAVNIKVYDGIPDKGGELIGDFVYEQKAVWLTYSPQTFKLKKRLRGVHTICLASSNGFDIEGFVFEKLAKEFTELNAADCDKIYGDSFTVNDTDVTGIGNNVVLDFGKFDFTHEQPAAIAITGRSQLPLNTINIDCKGDTEKRIIINFEGSDEYTERIFTTEKISGMCSISFTFLPGSNFDIRSFRFIK